MSIKLFIQAIVKFLIGIILVGFIIFVSAGTFYFSNGWLLISVLFLPMLFTGFVLMIKNPELLKKRLNIREKLEKQKVVVKLSGLMFILGFIVAGLNFRFNLYILPGCVVNIAVVIFIISYLFYGEVLRENTYLSRNIQVQDGQKVIDTGLYGIVRHPMYSATLFLFLSMPLMLGSIYSFFIFLLYPFIIEKRIKNEEEFLERELIGYSEYKKKVKYRLIPFIW